MKSCRLNKVALSWLHGGHQAAPQYSSSGFLSLRAWVNARSMSASLPASSQATCGPLTLLLVALAGAAALASTAAASASAAAAPGRRVNRLHGAAGDCMVVGCSASVEGLR